jgi:hypothetical protein
MGLFWVVRFNKRFIVFCFYEQTDTSGLVGGVNKGLPLFDKKKKKS